MKSESLLNKSIFFLLVLLSFSLQQIHSCIHLANQFSEKHCHHKYQKHKNEINHSHHDEDCSSCEFVFSNFHFQTAYNKSYVILKKISLVSLSIVKELHIFFSGSLFALRAPPQI